MSTGRRSRFARLRSVFRPSVSSERAVALARRACDVDESYPFHVYSGVFVWQVNFMPDWTVSLGAHVDKLTGEVRTFGPKRR
jgi:hypothetical protein